jgi:hypothetical protein
MLNLKPSFTRLSIFELWLKTGNIQLETLFNTLPGRLYLVNKKMEGDYEVLTIGNKVTVWRTFAFYVSKVDVCDVLMDGSHFLRYYAEN